MQSSPELCLDHNQVANLTSMMDHASLGVPQDQEMEVEDGSWPSNFGDNCASSLTHCHDLVCGHTVNPGPDIVGGVVKKQPCGPNCTRYVFLKTSGMYLEGFRSICKTRFVCPNCIEAWIRQQFKKLNEQRSMLDSKPASLLRNTTEKEIIFWTHRLVARLIDHYFLEYHMRPAEGLSGIFKLSEVDTYTYMEAPREDIALNLNFTGPKIDYELARIGPREPSPTRGRSWSYRGEIRRKVRDRSASPGPDPDVSMDIDEERKGKRDRHSRYRSPIRTRGIVKKTKEQEKLEEDIGNLADRLLDTRVEEGKGDELMDKLMGDLGLLSVDEMKDDNDH